MPVLYLRCNELSLTIHFTYQENRVKEWQLSAIATALFAVTGVVLF
jgi:hypothetical protein